MKNHTNPKTPISYYGGKQKLANTILSFIPEHVLYCEPFLGGAAVYFAKPQSEIEVINDTNAELINFYRVCKNQFWKLKERIDATLHSRLLFDDAIAIYQDALYIIKSRDTANSFFYCDPPYFNSDCAHYNGYSIGDFENLLKVLSEIKGKFLLSSYPSDILKQYVKANKWYVWSVEQGVSVNVKAGYQKRKVEVLTANYSLIQH